MRREVYTWIKLTVGNGRLCRFWTDNWSPYGSLEEFLSRPRGSRLGISANATLSDLFVEGQWTLPPARSEELLQVQIYLTTLTLVEEDDHYEWVLDGTPINRYSTGDVYRKLRNEEEVDVPLAHIVWIASGIPKHGFLTWMTRLRNRLTCIGWQATIYWIWNERNNRLHRLQYRSEDAIFRLLDRQIKDKILSFRQSSPINSSCLMQMWV
ncbi:hypothetical protein DY000_02051063 [Brassica cretica]|uniref:Reverse transcriptase zinc-binding domain-containing protein n=1 Tax=Brassica cretica TaxID=69181 RepID=A0ABQ7EZ11_BRACR|nr:hypothetical protein DY000_02051063 [Brassica cretica]